MVSKKAYEVSINFYQAKMLYPSSIGKQELKLVEQCLDKLIDLKFSSNNIMSSIGSQRDRLVQWCHGAPGAIHLYVLAYKVRDC